MSMLPLLRTRLLQRLEEPCENAAESDRVFGGLHTMGKDGWNILYSVCRIAYMGASEYEFGRIPRTMQALVHLAEAKRLRSFAMTLTPSERALNERRRWKKTKMAPQPVVVYGICEAAKSVAVVDRVKLLLSEPQRFQIKCGTDTSSALDPLDPYDDRSVGWMEHDNEFLFFASETMWKAFCDLFEVEVCDVPKVERRNVDLKKMSKPDLIDLAVANGLYANVTRARVVRKADLVDALSAIFQ